MTTVRLRTTITLAILGCALAASPSIAAATPAGEGESLQLTLPPAWYGVPGLPIGLYYDNVVLTEKPENYRFEISCDIGKSEEKRWAVAPDDKDVGDHPLSIIVKDSQGKSLGTATTMLRIVLRNAGEGKRLRLLIIGDSLTAASLYPTEIARLLSQPGNPQWKMLGTRKPRSAASEVVHEGIGGWTWSAFLSRYQPKENIRSPFIFAGDDGKPELDVPRYFRENCEDQPPDVVMFLLGINDCFGANPDDPKAIDKAVDAMFENADSLLRAFRAAAPTASFAIGLTTPPNSREEGFQANYRGKYHRWGWKRIQHRLVQRQIGRFSNRQMEGIYVVPTELNVDPVDGYPTNNGVHPNKVGYDQIGASFYGWLKWWMSEKQR
jgi:lysophospholipase L1-like esterase